jgi:23S rRNA (pseudouridine1915-N3)-methyltransferase
MKLRVLWVGKTKNPALATLCQDYVRRIRHFLPLDVAEVKEDRILAALHDSERVLALDPDGQAWTSEQFAKFLQQHMTTDPRRLTFVVGDYGGLPPEVKKRADVRWSLSPLTFTHEIARVLLLEQLYRAFSIIRNFPYSK